MDQNKKSLEKYTWRYDRFNLLSLVFLTLTLGICLLKIFYATPLRTRIENKLYDLRFRLAPNLTTITDILVLAIDEKTLNSPHNVTPGPQPTLSYTALADVLLKLEGTKVKAVGVLLPPQLFSYSDLGLDPIIQLVARDRRFSLGVFDINLQDGGVEALPPKFRPIAARVYKANMTRPFRREIVREVVIKEKGEMPYLAPYLGSLLNSQQTPLEKKQDHLVRSLKSQIISVRPNFVLPSRIPTLSVADWMALGPEGTTIDRVDDKVVLVGYTAYRPATLKAFEATFVNSPWQEEGYDVVDGIPLVTALAMTIQSLKQGDWLVPGKLWVNLFQTTIVSLLSLGAWYFSAGFASILFIGGWIVLLIIHGFLFASYSYYIPLADTALVSTFMTIVGALVRLRLEGRLHAQQQAKVATDRDVASVQDRFLNIFAEELSTINKKVRACLRIESLDKLSSPKTKTIFGKVVESCEELDDYLNGMSHFSRLEACSGQHQIKSKELKKGFQNIDLAEMVPRILIQFEARIREKHLVLEVHVPKGSLSFGDGPITAQILYNLISNAIKYSPNHGIITINSWMAKDSTKIQVRDHGPGIEAEFHQKVFEKFYRVKNDFVYKVKGHGLGLYLSSYFADLIQAKIELESEPGMGSSFTLVMLPPRSVQKSKTEGGLHGDKRN